MRYILCLFIVISSTLSAQTDSLNLVDGLHLQHKQSREFFDLPLESSVCVRLKDGRRIKGTLEEVNSSHLKVGGEAIDYQNIFFVGHRKFITNTGGVLLTLTGAGLLAAAIIPAVNGGSEGLVSAGLIGLAGVGIGIMGPGLIRDGKRYYMDDDWRVVE